MNHTKTCNCIVCAKEFNPDEINNTVLSKINITRFKICEACLDQTNPAENYREARDVISSYLWLIETKSLYQAASDILDDIKK